MLEMKDTTVGSGAEAKAGQNVTVHYTGWLSDAGKGFALRFANQFVDALYHALVLLLPIEVVLPSFVGKNQLHEASSRSTPLPAFSCPMAVRPRANTWCTPGR